MSTNSWLTETGSKSTFNGTTTAIAPGRVQFYDTTLRDGEQQSGVIFSTEQKIRIFRALEAVGIPMIETGMIGIGELEAEVVRQLAAEGTTAQRYVLARCANEDIELAAASGAQGVTLEFPSNSVLLEVVLGWSVDQAVEKAVAAVERAHDLGMIANIFAIDASRTEVAVLEDTFGKICASANPEYLTLADTMGVCLPSGASDMVSRVRNVSGATEVQVHFHEDFSLAAANSLAAIDAGASVVQGTWNGLGERAGNAPIPSIVLALEKLYGYDTGLDLGQLRDVARLIENESGETVPRNAPVVGRDLFDIEAGIAAAYLESVDPIDRRYFYSYLPSEVHADIKIVVGKGVGAANVRAVGKRLNVEVPTEKEHTARVLERLKQKAVDEGRLLTDAEFLAILDEEAR